MVQLVCHHSKTSHFSHFSYFHPFPSLSCLICPCLPQFSPGQLDFLAEHGYQAHCGTMRPSSRGTVQLSSGSALDAPLIDPNFLATEEDRRDLRAGLRLTVEILEQQALQEFKRDTGTKLRCGKVIWGIWMEEEVSDVQVLGDTCLLPRPRRDMHRC